MRTGLYIAATLIMFAVGCTRDVLTHDPSASVLASVDSLHFDTVFATAGSTTQAFKIYNPNSKRVSIDEIAMAGGNQSSFRLNADGFVGPTVQNLEIAAHDSAYVYVTVIVDPSVTAQPFVVQDSIRIACNGDTRYVQLDAWAQNARFLKAQEISTNTTWTRELPYVILGSIHVGAGATLTIEPGARIFVHNDAGLFIKGSLSAQGTHDEPILFTGDRLDMPYKSYPGSWGGIQFSGASHDNMLTHLRVENAVDGLMVGGAPSDEQVSLRLDKCVIDNCLRTGIAATNAKITAVNCLISNCGQNLRFDNGGEYSFLHCTVAAFSNGLITHKEPVLSLSDASADGSTHALDAHFTNCIFWGDNGVVGDEIDLSRQSSGHFSVGFGSCIWKMDSTPQDLNASDVINADPLFVKVDNRNNAYDFHLSAASPAIAAGASAGVSSDLDDSPRDPNFPDIGAYQATF